MNQSHYKIPAKYFIYCRKSTVSEDRQVLSIPAQLEELERYARQHNLEIVDKLTETKSAYEPGRPVFNSIIERLKRGEGNGLLVWAANRISRNSIDSGLVIYLLDHEIIKEIKTPGGTYTNTPEHIFALQLEFTLAKKSSDDLKVAVRRGNRKKFTLGEWLGPAKPGYLNMTDSITRRNYIVADKERLPLLRKAVDLILNGTHTPMQALDVLNNDWHYRSRQTKLLGGGPLSRSSWYRILSDSYYYGLMKRDGQEDQQGNHTPLMTEVEFDLLQVRLGKQGKPRITKHDFPYKSVLKCGECGGSITCQEKWQIICDHCKKKFARSKDRFACPKCNTPIEEMKNPKILHYVYYGCTKRVHPECMQGSFEIRDLEKQIDTELMRYEIPPEFMNWTIDNLKEVNDQEERCQNELKDSLLTEFNKIDQEIKNLVRLRISVDPDDEEKQKYYADYEETLLARKKNVRKQLDSYDERQDNWLELTKKTFNFACYARYWFEHGDTLTKTQILSTLGENLTVKDGKLLIQGEKPFFLIEKTKAEIQEAVKMLEPNKKIDDPTELLSLEPVGSSMRRGWDSNPRCLRTAV